MATGSKPRGVALVYERNGRPWTPKEDELLGTDTDRAIAAIIGRSSVSISNRRKKLGIPGTSRK